MKVKGLDGRDYKWDLTGHSPLGSEEVGSSHHERARGLLAELFSCDRRLEEIPLPGSGERDLRADFYLPGRSLVVEVHGQQHYKFTPLFHKSRLDFLKGQQRDRDKREWCELNGIRYCELPWDESSEQWTVRIRQAVGLPGEAGEGRPGPG